MASYSSSPSSLGIPDTFTCRLCPYASFTAAEKDAHREYHRARGDLKSTRVLYPTVPAPTPTNESIFVLQQRGYSAVAVDDDDDDKAAANEKRPAPTSHRPGPKRAKRSNKQYREPAGFGRKFKGA